MGWDLCLGGDSGEGRLYEQKSSLGVSSLSHRLGVPVLVSDAGKVRPPGWLEDGQDYNRRAEGSLDSTCEEHEYWKCAPKAERSV